MKQVIPIGVLGCAGIAVKAVIPAILELNDHYRLLGVSSRSYSKADQCAQRFRTIAFEGYSYLLSEAGLKAVYIPLPNSLHAEWIEKALKKGIHVLAEKPLATNYYDAVKLNRLAKKNNLALVENFQFRFHQQLSFIQDLVNKGVIGELRCLRSSFGFPGLAKPNDIRYQRALGGGALLDTGGYPLKIAQLFMGQEIFVEAASLNTITGKEVDIWGGAYVKQKNGPLFGEIAFGFNHHYQCNIELWGSMGKIFTNRIFTAHASIEPVIELETNKGKKTITLTADKHFNNMLTHFHRVITGDQDKEQEYKQNINQARLIEEVKNKAAH